MPGSRRPRSAGADAVPPAAGARRALTTIIRDAQREDAAAVAAIYAHYVRDTAITFELDAPDSAEFARRIVRIAARFPFLVAEQDGRVAAYAYADLYRARAAYRWVAETTVYVDVAAQRRGLGRTLYAELLDRLIARNYAAAVGLLALPNVASVALHKAIGFVHVGTQAGVGYKHGRWHDVGIWQRELTPRDPDPAEPL